MLTTKSHAGNKKARGPEKAPVTKSNAARP
jgi:hypothetical protein